jgi:hypothetical protein
MDDGQPSKFRRNEHRRLYMDMSIDESRQEKRERWIGFDFGYLSDFSVLNF